MADSELSMSDKAYLEWALKDLLTRYDKLLPNEAMALFAYHPILQRFIGRSNIDERAAIEAALRFVTALPPSFDDVTKMRIQATVDDAFKELPIVKWVDEWGKLIIAVLLVLVFGGSIFGVYQFNGLVGYAKQAEQDLHNELDRVHADASGTADKMSGELNAVHANADATNASIGAELANARNLVVQLRMQNDTFKGQAADWNRTAARINKIDKSINASNTEARQIADRISRFQFPTYVSAALADMGPRGTVLAAALTFVLSYIILRLLEELVRWPFRRKK